VDSALCSRSSFTIDDFLAYDYIVSEILGRPAT